MSVRTDILDAIKLRLEGIDGTGAYENTVRKVHRQPINVASVQNFPVLVINENRELYQAGPVQTAAGHLSRRVGFIVGGWVNSKANPAEAVALLLADVELALLGPSDHSLGGLAVDIILVSNDMLADQANPDISGFLLEAEVQYRTPHNDPNSAG